MYQHIKRKEREYNVLVSKHFRFTRRRNESVYQEGHTNLYSKVENRAITVFLISLRDMHTSQLSLVNLDTSDSWRECLRIILLLQLTLQNISYKELLTGFEQKSNIIKAGI